ncbi:hypothetical protein F4776DRAFT_617136 [Hypoxylon sp. NC0597]|nr:hypothetical protein F4776DRAFT_617136 [Hypoxylon sp. NC0597]
METNWLKVVNFSCEDISLVVSVDDQGWSKSGDGLQVRKFQGRRARAPKPLLLNKTSVFEEKNFQLRVTVNSFQPTFDWGLGCFGNSTKLVETGKDELVNLHWTDFNEIRTAKELFDGRQVWDGDEYWIRLVRLTQRGKDGKTEKELIQFHQAQRETKANQERPPLRSHRIKSEEFFQELVDMESGRSETGNEARNILKLEKSSKWQLKYFRDWIEEADFVESHAST